MPFLQKDGRQVGGRIEVSGPHQTFLFHRPNDDRLARAREFQIPTSPALYLLSSRGERKEIK
jgi:hypothetical protein